MTETNKVATSEVQTQEARTNEWGQPIGEDLAGWTPPETPHRVTLHGRHVTLEPVDVETHVEPLYAAIENEPERIWTYMPAGPFGSAGELRTMFEGLLADPTNSPYVVVVEGAPRGWLEYLRINAPAGCIEIGWVTFTTAMQRTLASTETQYLLMKQAFDLGYRRLEWKCDHLNAPSRAAAERLGYTYEGIFRQAVHYKGRNRDTAWFSITDKEWPAIAASFEAWLDPANFDADGNQRASLVALRDR